MVKGADAVQNLQFYRSSFRLTSPIKPSLPLLHLRTPSAALLLLGLTVGLRLGPLLDICWLARRAWHCLVVHLGNRLEPPPERSPPGYPVVQWMSASGSPALSLTGTVEEIRELFAGLNLVSPGTPITINIFHAESQGSSSTSAEPAPVIATPAEAVSASSPRSLSRAERQALAGRMGAWVARALVGEHRGSSGRDENALSSNLWLVFRTFEGKVLDPVRVCKSFAQAKVLVMRGSDLGPSVFVGLPSEWEAKLVVAAAGKQWPC